MIEPLLKQQLAPVAARQRGWRRARALAACWGVALVLGLVLLFVQRSAGWQSPLLMPLFAGAVFVATFVVWSRVQRRNPDYRDIARRVETHHPELHSLLLTAVEQQPDPATGKLNFLQERLVREAVEESRQHQWIDAVPEGRLLGARLAQYAAFVLLLFTVANLHRSPGGSQAALHTPRGAAMTGNVTVTPGDVTIERGSGLVVLARFEGSVPPEAKLVITASQGGRELPLTRNLADPVFGGSIPDVASNLTYRVEFAGGRSRDFTVTAFDYPAMQRADADIHYPDYTGLPDKRIPETRRVSAVEGSTLGFTLQLNKPVTNAHFVAKDNSVVPLVVDAEKPLALLTNFPLTASATYELRLVDADGRTNKLPAQFVLEALKNRTPELKILAPRGDQKVSALQEVAFNAEAWDDFSLRDYGLSYTIGGGEPKTLSLATNASAPNEKRTLAHLLKLEELRLQQDELVTWHVWADDIGPDGKVRRTASDMFFAEVRPFEEIFREGQSADSQQQEQQQQQGAGNEATKLAELQKQIINATWKLQRTSKTNEASPQYLKDSPVVLDSQSSALEQAEVLKQRANEPRVQLLVDKVIESMEKAVEHLTDATNSPTALPKALGSEQAAYQALLKLSEHEYQVSRSRNQRQQGQGQQAQLQRQLDQLDLKKQEDRYETQQQAQQQNSEQREDLQVANRLKELAQRQQDLNERIQELQSALQEADTEAEREELRRRLKRLREEEQEMLADIDELRQRMDRQENQSRMAEARQQLEQTRQDVQRAAEALEKESASQALASGKRAEQDLQKLRDDFRKKNSSQFSEEMRKMRSEARDLAQKQEDIGKQLEAAGAEKRKSLSEEGPEKQLAERLTGQRDALTNLLSNMREVTERAETTEPLLSKQLYDTLRQQSQTSTDTNLFIASELSKRSLTQQAAQFEQRARGEIDQLKQGVERAAQSVLGNDTEALRQAKRELDALSQELERELAQNGAGQRGGTNANAGSQNQSQRGQQSGQQQSQQQQDGQQTGQAGQQQDGQQAQNQQGQQGQPGQQQGQRPGENQRGQSGRQPGENQQAGQQGQQQSSDAQQQQQGQQDGQQQGQQQGQQAGQHQQGQQQGQGQQGQQANQQQGQQQGQQPGQQQGQGQQPGQQGQQPSQQQGQQAGQQGQQPSQQQGQQPGQQQGQQPGQQGQQGQQAGQQQGQQPGQQPGGPSQNPSDQENAQPPQQAQARSGRGSFLDAATRRTETQAENQGGAGGAHGPLMGPEFVNWSDRLRDVEEMLDQPDLRNEVSRVRERARAMRAELKRHGKNPQWPVVRTDIANPLLELRDRVAEELARREKPDSLVPIDRDPVPNKFNDLVRRYYEKLGSGEGTR